MKMEQTECFETSAYKLQTPGNYPKENIQHTEHGESLKSRKQNYLNLFMLPEKSIKYCINNKVSVTQNEATRTFFSNYKLVRLHYQDVLVDVMYLLSVSYGTHIQGVPGGMCQTSGECSLI